PSSMRERDGCSWRCPGRAARRDRKFAYIKCGTEPRGSPAPAVLTWRGLVIYFYTDGLGEAEWVACIFPRPPPQAKTRPCRAMQATYRSTSRVGNLGGPRQLPGAAERDFIANYRDLPIIPSEALRPGYVSIRAWSWFGCEGPRCPARALG